MTKIAGSEKIYLWGKNDVLEDGRAVLINSARIYCDAMDQVSNMGYPGWIRDEVAIHFDIFTVRTVRLRGSGHLGTDEQRPVVAFSLYLLE